MISEKKSYKCTFVCLWWKHTTKLSTRDTNKRASEFLIFLSSEVTFMWTSGFYENLCTYRRQEFKIIRERSLFNYFRLLLHFYYRRFNMELNMMLIVLSVFVCIRHFWTLQQIQWILCNLNKRWITLQYL